MISLQSRSQKTIPPYKSLHFHVRSTAEGSAEDRLKDDRRDQWFRQAQATYLASDWVKTEQLLLKLLKQDARDVEARLMLATLWKHQQRGKEALRQLDRLERLEAADRWRHEIATLRKAIEGQQTTIEHETADRPEGSQPEQPSRRLAA